MQTTQPRRETGDARERHEEGASIRNGDELRRDDLPALEILERITDPFSVLDDELRMVFANEAAAKLTGVDRQFMIGKRPWELVPDARDTSFVRAYERALREKVPVVVEDYFAPWDRWFEASIFPLSRGLSVYTRDVTDRKRAEALRARIAMYTALRADVSAALDARGHGTREMLQHCCEALVRHLGVAFARIWTVDDEGATLLLQASAGMYTHTDGGHATVPVGRLKIGLIAAERTPHLTNDVLHDPRVGNREWAAREGMVAFAGYPLIVDDRVVGVVAMFARDVLPDDTLNALSGIADAIAQGLVRRRTELELQARIEDLARSNAELEQFAYVASHDLQEPLRMVASYNQLLARRYKGKLDETADEFIGFTVEGVTRMQTLINDLLVYSRVGTRGGSQSPTDMEAALGVAEQNVVQLVTERHATITHDPLPTVTADQNQMVQVLQNLLSNAIKFHGDAPPCVHVAARREGASWIFSVRDNGIGIDPQYFERIFIIFQRLHPREKYPGTGIGLAICKKIIERHGGRIWVESKPGEGSTIFFSVPAQPNVSPRSAS